MGFRVEVGDKVFRISKPKIYYCYGDHIYTVLEDDGKLVYQTSGEADYEIISDVFLTSNQKVTTE